MATRERSNSFHFSCRAWVPVFFLYPMCIGPCVAHAAGPSVQVSASGRLDYTPDEQGNRIPDFSHCGYRGGDSDLPAVPVRVVVDPVEGDDGERIQAAIDYVAGLPKGEDGFHGAIRLSAGEFQIAGQILINSPGIVLQGSGAGEGGTTLRATGQGRRALIRVSGVDDRHLQDGSSVQETTSEYVPVGATTLELASTAAFSVGDEVLITRPSTAEWIAELGTDVHGVGWKPGTRDIRWDRTVTDVSGNSITIDSPITTALDRRHGGGTVQRYEWPGRLQNIGIEDVRLVSVFASNNPKDEDHSWYGITMDDVQNAWVRRIVFHHFAGGAILLGRDSKWITVEDCLSFTPVSENGGYRRHTYFTLGQLTLFNRCWSEQGRHDFSTGHCAAGPNAFVQCRAHRALGESGPIESWSSGVLYDNVRIDGNDLVLDNRWGLPPGAGWSAANCVLWQCRAANVRCFKPPGANNWALGIWSTPAGDGVFEGLSDFVKPQSLYQAQLRQRLGAEAAARIDPILGRPETATNPTYQEAARFLEKSKAPARRLLDLISDRITEVTNERLKKSQQSTPDGVLSFEQVLSKLAQGEASPAAENIVEASNQLSIENGWIMADSQVLTGRRLSPVYWRGSIRAEEAHAVGPNISRFAPGRVGVGLTEDINNVANQIQARGFAAYDHHYGLWYDRRRDDHLMVRRADGAVCPPFYEQPFARSGQGVAWDGLSKYDLTSDNPWYWNRLQEFAQLCDERGLLLVHENYFQHNILEAGAHWADCPWRPANNINDTNLPEPPPYIGDKRLFMAQHFYDVTNPKLRALHRRYIRHCLDAFADNTNVLQMTSAEFTGPLEFTQFWLDTVIEWQQDHDTDVLVALSCTKDVQDAILADPERRAHIDVIDISYWTYDRNFQLYAPEGGKYLSPRQHMRQLRPQASSFASIVKAVKEYREKYPEKAILYNAGRYCRSSNDGWAVLMGGGSLANVNLPPELAQTVPKMRPAENVVTGSDQWCLASPDGDYLVYTSSTEGPLDVHVLTAPATYRVRSIDVRTGEVVATDLVRAETLLSLSPKTNALWITRANESE